LYGKKVVQNKLLFLLQRYIFLQSYFFIYCNSIIQAKLSPVGGHQPGQPSVVGVSTAHNQPG